MLNHHRLAQVISCIAILAMLFSGHSSPSASAQGGDGLERQINAQTGKINFIAPAEGRTISAARILGASVRPENAALSLAQRFAPEFGLKDPEHDLREMNVASSPDGRATARYQQTYQDIPVMGGELIVNSDAEGNLYSINGEVSPSLTLSVQPAVDPAQARQTALEAAAKWYEKTPADFLVSEPELWVYDESLLRPSTSPAELVWRMEVTPKDTGMPVRELVLVNAQRGSLSLHFNQVDTAWSASTSEKAEDQLIPPTCSIQNGGGSGDLLFRPYVQYQCGVDSSGVGAGDFNNDGKNDVALSVQDGIGFQHSLLVFLQDGSGNLAQPVSYAAGLRTEYLAVGDLNHDGRDDIVTIDNFDSTISVYLQNNSGTLNSRVLYATNTGPDAIAVGDINADGWDDVVISHWNTATIGVFTQKADGTLNSMLAYASVQAGWDDIAIGDINGDGLNDVVKMNGQGLTDALLVYTQNNAHTLNSYYSISNCAYQCTGSGIEIGDVTGDGRQDVVMSFGGNGSSAKIAVFPQALNGSLQTAVIYPSYDIPEPVEIADMNSDAKQDVVVLHGGWLNAGIYSQQNNGTLGTEALYPIPYASYQPQDLSIGDVNNDGLSDILIADGQGLVILYRRSPSPDSVLVQSGNNQVAALQTPFAQLLKVKVQNYLGQPISGKTVTFTAPASGASGKFATTGTPTATAVTDANGIATAPAFTANSLRGGYIVKGTVTGLTSYAAFQMFNGLQNLKTFTANNGYTLPGTLLCTQAQPNCTNNANPHADAAHRYARGTSMLYATQHARDSIDNKGMALISTVHFAQGYRNAFWNGQQMVYGDGAGFPLADDVVAHELTHGVTEHESHLFYYYQSGAMNESFSDLWGEYYDQTNGLGNDSAGIEWLLGEDITGMGAIRDMRNPEYRGDPDRMTSYNYYTGEGDNGGVHYNSGVNNKAVYLMVNGDTFNGKTVTGLGWTKTAAIYYEVNSRLLSSGADYADLYSTLQRACTNLIGQKGITSADCAEVKDAVDAVEMNLQPVPGFNTDARVCDGNSVPRIILADDLEAGTANWTFQNGTYLRWQRDSAYFGPYAQSGLHSLYADDYPGTITDAKARFRSVTLPANAYLHFAQAYHFEKYSTSNYDGGVLEYTTNNGASWVDAGPLLQFNGYKGTIASGWGNPLAGRNAFVGASHGYISTRVNLASLAGKTVSFRWRMGLDVYASALGWWVDNVKVYTCVPPPGAFNKINPTNGVTGVGLNPALTWSNSPFATSYQYCYDTINDNQCNRTWVPVTDPFVGITNIGTNTTYYWQVRAVNSVGTTYADNQSWSSFTTTPTIPAGNARIETWIGATQYGAYTLASGQSLRENYRGGNNGPARIHSTNAVPLLGAERVIYKVNNVNTSFTEMMGLPDGQLDTTYWLPWYNNVDLDTQLRFANVSGSTATVDVTIGGQPVDGSPFTLLPGESTRQSFVGVSAGPVKIQSNVNIVATERLIYKVNNVNTSFSELMALPDGQLDTDYWLPWYNNVDLDTQLRFANVSIT